MKRNFRLLVMIFTAVAIWFTGCASNRRGPTTTSSGGGTGDRGSVSDTTNGSSGTGAGAGNGGMGGGAGSVPP